MSKKNKKKKSPVRWIILVGMVVLVGFLYMALGSRETLTQVNLAQVEERDIISSVTESGVIEPVLEIAIAADVSGEVIELKGKEGDLIDKGDLLVTIQPDNYQSALEQAQAAVNTAQANQLQARANREQAKAKYLQDSANFARLDQLFQKEVISQTEWETAQLSFQVSKSQFNGARASLQASRYQVSSSQASLKQARSNLRKTNIYASMGGTLTRQNVRKGERVVGTLQMAGTEVLRIADLSRMQVTVNINENDIRFLQIGDTAKIEIDAFNDQVFDGTVTEIAYSPAGNGNLAISSSSDQITNYEVKVLLEPASYQNNSAIMKGIPSHQSPFRPGMSAQVEIFTDFKGKVVAVESQSVTIRKPKDGDKDAERVEVVFVHSGTTVSVREVKPGISDDKYMEIKNGLKVGETIVTGPYRVLSKDLEDGMTVKIKVAEETGSN